MTIGNKCQETMEPEFNLTEGKKARDEGLDRVGRGSSLFMQEAMAELATLPDGEYCGEDIRAALSEKGIEPKHHNAWGALIMNAVRWKILVNTGRIRKSKSIRSHAHKAFIYLKGKV